MGVKSVLKKVGKVALKVAPYAAMAIPGVGPIASMAISAGTSALDKKLSGGSWKDSLLAGGIGAGTSYLGGKLPVKGIGPSSVGTAAKAAGKTSVKSVLGNIGKSAATGLLTGQGGTDSSWKDIAKQGVDMAINRPDQFGGMFGGGGGGNSRTNPSRIPPSAGPEEIGGAIDPGLGPSYNPFEAGRRQAIKNQPFRKGYDVISQGPEPMDDSMGNVGPEIRTPMPPIYSGFGGGRRKNQNQRQAVAR